MSPDSRRLALAVSFIMFLNTICIVGVMLLVKLIVILNLIIFPYITILAVLIALSIVALTWSALKVYDIIYDKTWP